MGCGCNKAVKRSAPAKVKEPVSRAAKVAQQPMLHSSNRLRRGQVQRGKVVTRTLTRY